MFTLFFRSLLCKIVSVEINTEKISFNLVTDRSRYLVYFQFIVSIVFDERNY